jgi:chromosome segregation ATPase
MSQRKKKRPVPAPPRKAPPRTPQRGPAVKAAKPAKAAPRARAASARLGATQPFMEELEAALVELRRLSREVVSARRALLAEASAGRGVEGSLRRELETLRLELKTARAELEIAQANTRRAETRLEAAAEAEARAREAQREAEHAADRARDELLWLRREGERRAPVAGIPAPAPSEGEP